ncbi:hypothetical protein ACFTRE_06960 [Bacillus subtilis]|uniref:hypothetical protein n=1 Tax=Bacillus subtilis TaxID=1423 RepID=UPI00034B4517|nr:hypothetical protein [Bacillus subtilis]KIN39889.1 hypothetical protein B4070_0275 [Bacillus subtilis]QAW06886.1 hypothetical protein ETA15_01225 [Bacillus subtilis]WBC24892.1 hypothetical protein O6U12_16240 [Bacillus subtilis]
MIKWLWILSTITVLLAISGCSSDEVIKVGTPFNDNGTTGVKFNKEIKDSESIVRLRTLIDKEQDIEKPTNLNNEPEAFLHLIDQRIVFQK